MPKDPWWKNQKVLKGLEIGAEVAEVAVHLTSTTSLLGKSAVAFQAANALLRPRSSFAMEREQQYPHLGINRDVSGILFATFRDHGKLEQECSQPILRNGVARFRLEIPGSRTTLMWVAFTTDPKNHNAAGPWYDGTEEEARNLLGRTAWEVFGPRIEFLINTELKTSSFASDLFVAHASSKKAKDLHESVEKYNAKGHHRSLLLHGPPGTGKSYIARHIAHLRGGFSLRIRPKTGAEEFITGVAEVLRPRTIIIDDLDRVSANLLDTIEILKGICPLVITTVNFQNRLDPALRRPGRFDESHHIEKLDDEALNRMFPDTDPVLLQRLARLPIAYGEEYRLAHEVHGPEHALERLEELEKRAKELDT